MLESNYVAFWIDDLIFFGCLLNRVVCPSLPWTSFSRSTSPCADAFLLNILRPSGSVPALSVVFPLVCCCRTPRSNSFAKPLCRGFLYRSFPSALVSSLSSLRFTLAVRLSKPFRCLWTKLSLCVMALRTGIKDKRRLVEPLYWFLKAAGPPRCVVVQSRCSLSTKKIQAPNLRWWYLSGPTIT